MSDEIVRSLTPVSSHDDESGIDITAVTTLKHADLWVAVKKMGSQANLARYLGVQQTELSEWIRLKRCPPPEPMGSRWTEEFFAQVEGKLLALTGKTWDELFPKELRENSKFLDCEKTIERTARIRSEAMQQYALASRERMQRLAGNVDEKPGIDEKREALDEALQTLSRRRRLMLQCRYGIGGPYSSYPMSIEQIAQLMRISVSKARDVEEKALQKLRDSGYADLLRELAHS